MVPQPQATYAGLEAAVRDLKSAYDLCQAAIIPSPRDGSIAKDLPRYYELNEAALKEWLPGTLLLTTTGELRYVPVEEAVRQRSGGWQFRTVAAGKRGGGWSNTRYYSESAARIAFKAAIMGVCTEPGGQGRAANLVLDSDGNAVKLAFATEPDDCLLYTSPSPRDRTRSRMPSSA